MKFYVNTTCSTRRAYADWLLAIYRSNYVVVVGGYAKAAGTATGRAQAFVHLFDNGHMHAP